MAPELLFRLARGVLAVAVLSSDYRKTPASVWQS